MTRLITATKIFDYTKNLSSHLTDEEKLHLKDGGTVVFILDFSTATNGQHFNALHYFYYFNEAVHCISQTTVIPSKGNLDSYDFISKYYYYTFNID